MLKRILIIFLSCMTTNVIAYSTCMDGSSSYEWQRYAGADFKYAGINPRSDWRYIFVPDYPTSNLYFGIRFYPQFGIELGYEAAKLGKKDNTFNQGQTFFGNNVSGVQTVSSIRFAIWHIDFCYFYPISPAYEDIDLFASIGLGEVQTSLNLTASPNTPGTVAAALNNMQLQRTSILRVRIGAEYMSTSYLGIRALVGYDGTNKIKVKGVPAVQLHGFNVLTEPFKDSLYVSLGLIFKF